MIITRINAISFVYRQLAMFSAAKGPTPRRLQNRQPKRPSILSAKEKAVEYNPVQAIQLMRLHQFTTFQ